MKFFLVLVLAVAPVAAVAFVLIQGTFVGGAVPSVFSQYQNVTLSVSGVNVHAYSFFLVVLAITGLFLGVVVSEILFIARVRALLAWVKGGEGKSFSSTPIPDFGPDELGELGRQLALSLVHFSQSEEKERDLTDQKAQFLTATAHQLRTPLTELLWSFDSLSDPDTDSEAKKKIAQDVDSTLKRMRLIINHIIATADIGNDRFGYVFEKIDIVAVIEALIAEFMPVSSSRGVAIRFEHSGNTFPVYADKERISVALFNIISNAVDYTPKGGSVIVSVEAVEKRLRVSIQDSGIGISAAELPFLFNKFYRGDRAKHTRPDGTGLGLFLARNIIERHGSSIEVTSEENKGARFSFFLDSNKMSS